PPPWARSRPTTSAPPPRHPPLDVMQQRQWPPRHPRARALRGAARHRQANLSMQRIIVSAMATLAVIACERNATGNHAAVPPPAATVVAGFEEQQYVAPGFDA